MRKIAAFFFLFFAPVAYGQVNVSGSQIQIGGTTSGVISLTTNGNGGLSSVSAGVLNIPVYGPGNVLSRPNFASLVGAFTDTSGNVIEPVSLGNGPTTLYIPFGATQLQLGTNDSDVSDVTGSWVISVNGTNHTIPGTSAPWVFTGGINSRYPLGASGTGINGATAPVVVSVSQSGGSNAVIVQYVSGTIHDGAICGGSGSGPWDASGQPNCVDTFDNTFGHPPGDWVTAAPSLGTVASVSNSDGSLNISPTTGAVVGSVNYAHAGTWTALETFNAGVSASALTLSGITGSTQCLHVSSSGVVSGTGADCGSGSGGLTVGTTTISGGSSGNGLYDNAGVLGEKAFAPALGNCTVETANFSAAAASCYVGNASSGITATLPAVSTGAIIRIQNINAGTVTASFGSAFNCTLNGTTTSGTTCAIANGSTGLATTDGTSWYVAVTPTATGGSSLPSGTTNQLLYYAAPGTTVTPLTLGTNLSIASGTLNAAGGSAVIGVQHTFTFSSAGSQTFTHNLGLQYPFYSCATTSGATFDPTWMTWVDANNVTMNAPAATTTVCNFGQSNTATSLSNPAACPDTSGSGTAQSCTTTPTITVAANACIAYSTTTANSGTGLTIAVNGGGGAPVAVFNGSTWSTTLTVGVIPANRSLLTCYDGTDWDVQTPFLQPLSGFAYSPIAAPPATGSFTNINFKTGTTLVANGSPNTLFMAIPHQTALNWQIAQYNGTMPSTPWMVSALLSTWQANVGTGTYTSSTAGGLYLYDGTKLEGLEFLYQTSPSTNVGALRVEHMANVTTDASTVAGPSTTFLMQDGTDGKYVAFCYDGTNVDAEVSMDGQNWIRFFTDSSAFITPTSVAFGGVDVSTSAPTQYVSVKGWAVAHVSSCP